MIYLFQNKKNQKGATLIEVMVYIALFGIIIWGGVITAFHILESSGSMATRAWIQEEGDFLIAKMNWVLSGVREITAPPLPPDLSCNESDTLSVQKWDASLGTLMVTLLGDTVMLSRNGGTSVGLNSDDTKAHALRFAHCTSVGATLEYVKVRFVLTGTTGQGKSISKEFFTTVYLRK